MTDKGMMRMRFSWVCLVCLLAQYDLLTYSLPTQKVIGWIPSFGSASGNSCTWKEQVVKSYIT